MASRARVFLFAGIAGPPGKRKNDSSGSRGSRAHPVLEMLKRLRELYDRVRSPHQLPANLRRLIQQLAIPAEMFARDPHPTLLAVKGVQGLKMRQDDITQVGALKWRRRISLIQMGVQMGVDSSEDPWRTMTRAADHYSVGTREIKHLARFLRRGDVAVREHRNAQLRLDGADRVVLGGPCVEIRACAPVDRERGDATTFRDARDLHAVRVLAVPASADLERHRHVHGAHYGMQYPRHQRLIPEQRRAAQPAADFLGRTAHVHVDDLGAEGDVGARSRGERRRVCAGELHQARLGLALEIGRASCRESVAGAEVGGASRRRHTRYIGDWSSDVCSSDLATSASSLSSAEPHSRPQTFLAGQPMFTSMIWAPRATLARAAAASAAGSAPASCTKRGSGSPSWSMRWRDLLVCHRRMSEVIISDAARPAPRARHSSRNGRSVTPAIGASTTGEGRT